MRVFVTGATGFIGSAIVKELIEAGHDVLGLARSDTGASQLRDVGAQVHRGDLDDIDGLCRGAENADGVIHTAFIHDFSKFVENCETDRRLIAAFGKTLAGSTRPLIVTSGTALAATPGRLATEEDAAAASSGVPRIATEQAAAVIAAQGVRVSVVRLPPAVHDTIKQGLVTYLIALAHEKGVSAYVGEGKNRWPTVHRLDAAHLFKLAFEKGAAHERYHAIGEEGLPLRDIAEAIGRSQKLPVVAISPEEAASHFGWLAHFVMADCPASCALTHARLGWTAKQRGLIADLDAMG